MSTDAMIVGPRLGEPSGELLTGPPEQRNIEDPTKPITAAQLAELLSGGPTASGKSVTPSSAMQLVAVLACVQVIGDAIASMPLVTYERLERGKRRAPEHQAYGLLHTRPSEELSAFGLRFAIVANALLGGNGYAEIVRTRSGRPAELVPVEWERVRPFRAEGQLRYEVWTDGGNKVFLRRDILHVPGLSFNGIVGMSVIQKARQSLGAAMAADEFAGAFWRNSARPSGVFRHPGKLSEPAYLRLRESIDNIYTGSLNAGRPFLLEEGMEWSSLSMPLGDAQFLETRQWDVEQIARLFKVPPHKIGHLLRSTNNNIEQQGLDFLQDCLLPWVVRIEHEFNHKLFLPEEREHFFCEHLVTAILRADMKARAEFYWKMRMMGAMSPDDIRELENMNPIGDDRGTVYVMPSNMMPLPTPEQADSLLESFAKRGLQAGQAGGQAEAGDAGGDESKSKEEETETVAGDGSES